MLKQFELNIDVTSTSWVLSKYISKLKFYNRTELKLFKGNRQYLIRALTVKADLGRRC
jgi:hypothetical protein